MNQQQADQLYRTVYDYSVVRKAYVNQVHGAVAWAEMYGAPYRTLNQIIQDLDSDLHSTPERQAFLLIVQAAKTDDVLEKYLRAAHSEYFLGRPLDPATL